MPCLQRTQSCGTRGRGWALSVWLVCVCSLCSREEPKPSRQILVSVPTLKGFCTSLADVPLRSVLAGRRGCACLARALRRGEGRRPGGGDICLASAAASWGAARRQPLLAVTQGAWGPRTWSWPSLNLQAPLASWEPPSSLCVCVCACSVLIFS